MFCRLTEAAYKVRNIKYEGVALSLIHIINGPNLNLLGRREPEIYGHLTLAELEQACMDAANALGWKAQCRQSNHEGELVEWLQQAGLDGTPVVLNPGAYTHTSIALHDAIKGAATKVIEVHLSNVHAREPFRHKSFISPVAYGTICGLGLEGYRLAIAALAK